MEALYLGEKGVSQLEQTLREQLSTMSESCDLRRSLRNEREGENDEGPARVAQPD